ncbi:hypothetical protein ACF1BS_28195 [Streptomyces sp. NPDC014748]|uniref:hypothetical protein n=1 Tax=Streptomyces sp. NPDC014748 TaxID=3364905 RepID=UPI003703667E
MKTLLGAPAGGESGSVSVVGWLPGGFSGTSVDIPQKLPATRTLHVSTAGGVSWELGFTQYGGTDKDGFPIAEAGYTLGPSSCKPGRTYPKTVDTGVSGPRLGEDSGLFRTGDEIYGALLLFADPAGHAGFSDFTSVDTTLYRNGAKVGSNNDPLFGGETCAVPAGDAAHRLTTSVKRSPKVARLSTGVDATWVFRSRKPPGTDTRLPASVPHFGIATGLGGTVPVGKKVTFPVTVEGSAAGGNLKSLRRASPSPSGPRSPTRRATHRKSPSSTRTSACERRQPLTAAGAPGKPPGRPRPRADRGEPPRRPAKPSTDLSPRRASS